MKALVITVVGILVGLAATMVSVNWLAVAGAAIALLGAYVQYKDTLPYSCIFTEASWKESDSGFTLSIDKALHRKASPTATVFEGVLPNFEVVGINICISADETVLISGNSTFPGKVVVK